MIGWLRGHLRAVAPGRVLLDVGGVGYSVRTSLTTYYELERLGLGAPAELRIHTHVREDAIELFGFASEDEQALFEKLIGVSGIGPRLAQSILSGMAPREVLAALAASDIARLVRIPGVGKKTAERMALELRESAQQLLAILGADPRAAPPPRSDEDDIVQALVNLGYRAPEAEKAVQAAKQDKPDAPFQDLLRAALRRLAKV
ncbi:MAG TPA: Holliday junction branch migration protein RuvA [Thermoanaerobaculia bacterium]|nr:Holliday junction branch migration protein RuvA [Thermoanaerobaculia bacterium]